MASNAARFMTRKLSAARHALEVGLVGHGADQAASALFIDGNRLAGQVSAVQAAFPGDHFNHAFAVKANPTYRVLSLLSRLGMGLEAASMGELQQALRAGQPSKIVYDCPVKTLADTRYALEAEVDMNIDNWQELARVDDIVAAGRPASTLGIRLNPQVGAGSIATHATATATSKFGIGMQDHYEDLVEAYMARPWLTMAHVHVGSQGVALDMSVAGIRAVLDFCADVNKRAGFQQITQVDIGGGLSVNFASEVDTPTFQECAELYAASLPELFTGEYQVITEYGRAIAAKSGFAMSRVEFAKVSGGRHIALQHLGADLMLRTIYHPDTWPLRITCLNADGTPKTDPEEEWVVQDVAGPCCIQGDILAHQRKLPLLEEGDWVVAHDVGAYMHASYSSYNARQCPGVYGFGSEWSRVDPVLRHDAGDGDFNRPGDRPRASFVTLQPPQTVDDTLAFYSHERGSA